MRITLLFILTISWHRSGIRTQQCGKPEVTRVPLYIYRRPEELPVKVNRCLFNDTKHAYSDITENCINAFKTGVFKDKYLHVNHLKERGSPVVLEEYITSADWIKNEIKLKSGAVCRYDRGFCYDPTETNNYAVVWDVIQKPLQVCPKKLELLFSGFADIWEFQQGHLKYVVYFDENGDRAFYLKIVKKVNCDNKNIFLTEDNFIVSLLQLNSYPRPRTLKRIEYFSLDSKRKISEAILKNCDLQQYPLDFTNRIGYDYMKDSRNLKTILEYLQSLIITVKLDVKTSLNKLNTGDPRVWDIISRNMSNLQSVLDKKVYEINKINNSMKKLQYALGKVNGNMNETMRIIGELQQEDRRIISKINNEYTDLAQKFSILENSVRNQRVTYPTRTEFNREISTIQREINNKMQVFINKLDSVLKDNYTNLKNNDSKFQKDITDRYDKSLEKLEHDFEDLDESVKNLKSQLDSELNHTNVSIINNFSRIKNILVNIQHDISEIQPFLMKWQATEDKSENLRKDLDNQKNKFTNILREGETYMKSMQTNLTNIQLTTLNNEYNITDMKNRFEKMLKKFSSIDWEVLKNLKPDSISKEDFQSEINKYQRDYDEKIKKLSEDINLTLKQYETSYSSRISELKSEIFKNIDSSSAEVTRKNSEDIKQAIGDLKKLLNTDFVDIRESVPEKFKTVETDLSELKSAVFDTIKEIFERLNDTKKDITNMGNEISKCKLDSLGTVKIDEGQIGEMQKDINNTNKIVLKSKEDISNIEKQLTQTNNKLVEVKRELGESTQECIESSRNSLEVLEKQTNLKLSQIKNSTLNDVTLLGNQLKSIRQNLLNNHEPLLERVDYIENELKKIDEELKERKNHSAFELGASKNELKKIHDSVIEAKKRSMNNAEVTSILRNDFEEINTELKKLREIHLKYSINLEKFNQSLQTQEKSVSKIFPELERFNTVINVIKTTGLDMENNDEKLKQAIEQVQKELKTAQGDLGEIKKQENEINNLKNQVQILGTDVMNKAEVNEDILSHILKNISDISSNSKNKDEEIADLKAELGVFLGRLDENKRLVETSKLECMNYVNTRMRSVTEEITQIHNLLLQRGEEIKKVESQLGAKLTTCCDETRKQLNEKDILIGELTVKLEKAMKQLSDHDERLNIIMERLDENLNERVPDQN